MAMAIGMNLLQSTYIYNSKFESRKKEGNCLASKFKMKSRMSSSTSLPICFLFLFFLSLGLAAPAPEMQHHDDDADKLRSQFLHLLRSRRSPQVPLIVEPAKPVLNASTTPLSKEILESIPEADIKNLNERLKEENFYLRTEAAEQGRLPVLILSLKDSTLKRRPAVVFLHSTGSNKESVRPFLEAYASREYIAIAIDSRYHGERGNLTIYQDALVSSWKKGDTMPFIYDTVWDLIKLADYLSQRKDINPARIGITGISLGGMHSWFAAFADTRYAVTAPIIGVQGFQWAIENDKWQARVDSIRPVFEKARIDLGKTEIDKVVVQKVWDRIAPGLASQFDSPYSIPAIAPRPLLILNGADDPRCPIGGIKTPTTRARNAYAKAHSSNNFKIILQPETVHELTPLMVKESSDWMDKFLK